MNTKISDAAVEAAQRALYFAASPDATEADYIRDSQDEPDDAEDVREWTRAALAAALPHLAADAVPVSVATGVGVNGQSSILDEDDSVPDGWHIVSDFILRELESRAGVAAHMVPSEKQVPFGHVYRVVVGPDHPSSKRLWEPAETVFRIGSAPSLWVTGNIQYMNLYAHPQPAALNEVSGNSGELTALVAKWRAQAATNEVNGLEADSIGLTGAAMRHDARQHVLEQAATELEAALAATGKQQGGEVEGVDLEQFRESVELLEWVNGGHNNPDWPTGDADKHAEAIRLLALIDSQCEAAPKEDSPARRCDRIYDEMRKNDRAARVKP